MRKTFIAIIVLVCASGCTFMKSRMLERTEETVTVGTYQVEASIARSPEEIFDFLADWRNMHRMMDYATFEPPAKNKIEAAGEYSDAVIHMFGLNIPMRYIVIEYDPPRRITIAQGKGVRGWMTLSLDPVEGGTMLRIIYHAFFVPDSPSSAIYLSLASNEKIVKKFVSEAMTGKFLELKSELEGKPGGPESLSNETYKVFVDAYFMVEQDFKLDRSVMFETLGSARGLNRLLAGKMEFEPRGKGGALETGEGLTARIDPGPGGSVEYDAYVIQSDYPDQFRLILFSPDVIMEWDFLVMPTAAGSRVICIMIMNFTESESLQSLDALMHTSEMDKWVGEGLARMQREMQVD